MTEKLIINGMDAWTTWGVFLEIGSYNKLLTGVDMKEYTTNESRSIDGKIVSMKNPRVADRDVTIVFCITRENSASFLQNLRGLIQTLQAGRVVGGKILPNTVEVSELNSIFKFIYLGSLQLEQVGLELGKIAVKFNEPNPADR